MSELIRYFVFTSAEEGVSGIDWGVKFASNSLGDKYALDETYRGAINAFPIDIRLPDLGRISNKSATGLLLLPWPDNRNTSLLGFAFPNRDLAGRPTTSLVAALVPRRIYENHALAETAKRLWTQNPIDDIAKRPEERRSLKERPAYLKLDLEAGIDRSLEYPKFYDHPEVQNLRWPSAEYAAFAFSADDITEVNEYIPEKEESTETPRKKKKYFFWLAAAILAMCVVGLAYTWLGDKGKVQENPETPTPDAPPVPAPVTPPSTVTIIVPPEDPEEKKLAISESAKKIVEDVIAERPTKNLNGLLAVYFVTSYDTAKNVMILDDKLYGDSLFSRQEEIKLEYPGDGQTGNDQIRTSRQAFLSGLIDFLKKESQGGDSISRNGRPGYRLKIKDSKNFPTRFKEKINSLLIAEQSGDGSTGEQNVDVEQIKEKIADALTKKSKDETKALPFCAFVFESENGRFNVLFDREGNGRVWTREYYPSDPRLMWVDAAKVRRNDWTKENDNGAYFIVSGEADDEIVFYPSSPPESEPKDIEEFFGVFANQLLKDIEISQK